MWDRMAAAPTSTSLTSTVRTLLCHAAVGNVLKLSQDSLDVGVILSVVKEDHRLERSAHDTHTGLHWTRRLNRHFDRLARASEGGTALDGNMCLAGAVSNDLPSAPTLRGLGDARDGGVKRSDH